MIGASNGDVYDRYLTRVAEMRESVKICNQALERIDPVGAWAVDDKRVVPPPKDQVYTEMEALIQHFLIYSQGFKVPAGDAYVPVEGPRGEHGCYVVSDGTNRPWRVHMRAPGTVCLPGAAQVRRRRHDRGRDRRDRLARRGDGRRGSMSFHPTMPYGTEQWHRSMRATLPEGPEFAYTRGRPREVRGVRVALRARAPHVGGAARALSRAGAAGLHQQQRRAPRRAGDRLHDRGSRRRRLVLRDVPPRAGGQVRAAGVHHAVVRARRRRARHRRTAEQARHQGRRNRSDRHVHHPADGMPRRLRSRAGDDGEQRPLARAPAAGAGRRPRRSHEDRRHQGAQRLPSLRAAHRRRRRRPRRPRRRRRCRTTSRC